MAISLYPHQRSAIAKLRSGSVLVGGVGTGKSRTALAYFYDKECGGNIEKKILMKRPKDLYIITTARKRDTKEWLDECRPFLLSDNQETNYCKIKVVIDSWNNIQKYVDVENAFFIFDEQRVVGSGTWVKSFLKIVKKNRWILLSATPGDVWMDYVPIFVANGFYKNRTEFIRRHVIYSRFTKYPKVERYIETERLDKFRRMVTVNMRYSKKTTPHNINIFVDYDKGLCEKIQKDRWHIFEERPLKDVNELCFVMRRLVNTSPLRIDAVRKLIEKHPRSIIFYNFNYELKLLRNLMDELKITYAEWNGHKHEPVPKENSWVYLVQYTAGAEGWNCIETDTIIFYSQNYSYKVMQQSAGRIDRLNTPYSDLYYYHLKSNSMIDKAIANALSKKRNFNESSLKF